MEEIGTCKEAQILGQVPLLHVPEVYNNDCIDECASKLNFLDYIVYTYTLSENCSDVYVSELNNTADLSRFFRKKLCQNEIARLRVRGCLTFGTTLYMA